MNQTELLAQFANPQAKYRSMPLWVWNGQVSEERITEMLEQYAARGFGGVFVHPRPGLITEYLSDRWFELWRFAATECARLGMECNIYDENSYPAGFAGGHVPANRPDAAAQYVEAVLHHQAPVRFAGRLLGAYRIDTSGHAIPLDSGQTPDQAVGNGTVLTLALRVASGNPWTAWFPMVDITRPEVVREFIATTHAQYKKRLGKEFGRTITTVFSDEPMLTTAGAYAMASGLPLSRLILRAFRADHQYDLQPRLADLFVDQPGCRATRFDYYLTLQRLWTGNFMRPLFEWCDENKLVMSGHYNEHEWPSPVMSPSCMDAYRWMHMPGVDLLRPQCCFTDPATFGHFTMTFRELNSAANQLGRARRLCEIHGVGGYEATLAEIKQSTDWIMVHGINFINQHLSYQTISGARKYDHPQTFSDHSAWWDDYGIHADHVARLSMVLSQGTQINRVLVLHSTTAGWTLFSPAAKITPSPLATDAGAVQRLRDSEAELVRWLVDRQVDFDLGDELLMADHGEALKEGRLRVGEATYKVVVIPPGMENVCRDTVSLLEKYLLGGGIILSLRDAPTLVNGRADDCMSRLADQFPHQWQRLNTLAALQERLDQLAPPLITTHHGAHLPALIGHQMRRMADGQTLHYLANHNDHAIKLTARVRGASVQFLDTLTGDMTPLAGPREGDHIHVPLEMPVAGHAVWLVSDVPATTVHAPSTPHWRAAAVEPFSTIERLSPNVLALDFCDLTLEGRAHPGLYVTRANRLCWESHGFDADVWDRAIQYRRNFIDMSFDASTGFRADYHVQIADGAINGIELAIERPDLYRVEVNGSAASFAAGERWFDETIRKIDITSLLRPGSNIISLIASPFHILCEIAPIYLLGDFAVDTAEVGFTITPARALRLGDWVTQGLAHYDRAVRYTTAFTLEQAASRLRVEVPMWTGSVLRVRVDDAAIGSIAFPPYELISDQPLKPGRHTLSVDVVGTPKNLLGPHFDPKRRDGSWIGRRWIGPPSWDHAPSHPAPGASYELDPYGLLAPVKVAVE